MQPNPLSVKPKETALTGIKASRDTPAKTPCDGTFQEFLKSKPKVKLAAIQAFLPRLDRQNRL
jgi:hypothetical protein